MDIRLKGNKGVTFIEILISLVISSILIASIYRLSIGQQKTYAVQEQVVDMQQNARIGINRMMSEIRMAGFGNVSGVLPLSANEGPFSQIISPRDDSNNLNNLVTCSNNVNHHDDEITIIGGLEQISTLKNQASVGDKTIVLNGYGSKFNLEYKKYVCIGGVESHEITNPLAGNTLTLIDTVIYNHNIDTPVFMVKAINYRLRCDNDKPEMPVLVREDKTKGGGSFVVAENIENLQFEYFDASGNPATPANIRMVRVTVRARTDMPDPKFKGGVGEAGDPNLDKGTYRIRQIASNVYLRNMGLSP